MLWSPQFLGLRFAIVLPIFPQIPLSTDEQQFVDPGSKVHQMKYHLMDQTDPIIPASEKVK